MSARLYPLRRCQPAEFADTTGHPQPMVHAEGLVHIDTRRMGYVPPASTDPEELRRMTVKRCAAEHWHSERRKTRQLALYAGGCLGLVLLGVVSSWLHPSVWAYGWTP